MDFIQHFSIDILQNLGEIDPIWFLQNLFRCLEDQLGLWLFHSYVFISLLGFFKVSSPSVSPIFQHPLYSEPSDHIWGIIFINIIL